MRWTFLDGVEQVAWAYNGMVPGPLIRVTEGDRVRFIVRNDLPDDTTIHWHGIEVPNDIEFTATEPGMWMVHCHISHHTTNDGEEPGGLMMMIDVKS